MKKGIKKIIAMVCAIAMVVSSMTINTKVETKAADYSTLEGYKTITNSNWPQIAGTCLENSQYVFDGNTVAINPFQYQDDGTTLYMAFPGDWASGLKAVANGTEIAGSGNQIFIRKSNEIHMSIM